MINFFGELDFKEKEDYSINIAIPDTKELKVDILKIKKLLEKLMINSQNNKFKVEDKEVLFIEKQIRCFLNSYNTSAEVEFQKILNTLETMKKNLSNKENVDLIQQHIFNIENDIDNWLGWYNREHGFSKRRKF